MLFRVDLGRQGNEYFVLSFVRVRSLVDCRETKMNKIFERFSSVFLYYTVIY